MEYFFPKNVNECISKINPIIIEMTQVFTNLRKRELDRVEMVSGDGYIHGTNFYFEKDDYAEVVWL